MKPTFQFMANSTEPGDRSGIAVWRYTDQRQGEDVETVVRQSFSTFDAAHEVNELVGAAWRLGEASGHAACEAAVLGALRCS